MRLEGPMRLRLPMRLKGSMRMRLPMRKGLLMKVRMIEPIWMRLKPIRVRFLMRVKLKSMRMWFSMRVMAKDPMQIKLKWPIMDTRSKTTWLMKFIMSCIKKQYYLPMKILFWSLRVWDFYFLSTANSNVVLPWNVIFFLAC